MSQRINQYLASHTSLSRRSADDAISAGRVRINDQPANLGAIVSDKDVISLDGAVVVLTNKDRQTIMLHKPIGYVCSRDGQGSKTIYDLLPPELHHLHAIGRLDKDSSGLLLLTNDGELSHSLTHPSYQKDKVYQITLDKPLDNHSQRQIAESGIELEDGLSQLALRTNDTTGQSWTVTMHEGRNRQIRRTFAALGFTVTSLHRIQFGDYSLGELTVGNYQSVK